MDTLTADPKTMRRREPFHGAVSAVLGVLMTIIGLIVLAWLILFVTKGRFLKPTFERYASRYADRQVAVAGDFQFYFNPFHLKFLAEGLTLANPSWAHDPQLFSAKLIDAEISTFDLIFGRQHILFLNLDGGSAGLEIDAAGRNTWTFAGNTPFKMPPIDRAAVTGTIAHYIDAKHKADVRLTFGDLNGSVGKRDSGTVTGPLTFAGGGTALAAPFKLHGSLTTPNSTIVGGKTGLDLHAYVAATQIDVSGTLPGATRIEGADLRVTLAGKNLQTLFKLAGANAPPSRPYKLAANFTKSGDTYKFTNLAGRFGDSDLAGRLSVTTGGARSKIVGDLHTQTLDILDVGPWIGYSPDKLDAQGGKGAITIVNGHPRVLPDASLDITSLKGFDADVHYTAAHIRTGNVPIANLTLTLDLDDRDLKLKPVAFDVIGGRVTADIELDAHKEPVVADYDIRMTQVPIGRLLTSFKVEDNGTTANVGGRIKLRGAGDSVRTSLGASTGRIAIIVSQGTLWVRNIELAKLDVQNFLLAFFGKDLKKPRDIRCGLAAFTVTNGISRADPVIFDTGRAVYRMNGQFSFKDEAIDLSLRGRSKELSLFSGQSPIGVGGWFAAPKINPISKELLTRGGASVLLGIVGTPIAAILPFVDLGTAKNSNCAAVEGAKTAAVVDSATPDPKIKKKK
ncbi:AsmA family protein [Polymorphobacter sp. PAMC 29334]|uniref:AsmA family protein n=1 Tax=Polymorphobacter sp. PAMC 29334 TaxID=2862331 RepID=UPI001C790AA7|nr:AsmA family protein [Polymorphobacter sp. PAMC 29334]QYE36130.1 AsmA family protein [Polymorphobacter sp. PAMC 29334]